MPIPNSTRMTATTSIVAPIPVQCGYISPGNDRISTVRS